MYQISCYNNNVISTLPCWHLYLIIQERNYYQGCLMKKKISSKSFCQTPVKVKAEMRILPFGSGGKTGKRFWFLRKEDKFWTKCIRISIWWCCLIFEEFLLVFFIYLDTQWFGSSLFAQEEQPSPKSIRRKFIAELKYGT